MNIAWTRRCTLCRQTRSLVGGRTFTRGKSWHCKECRGKQANSTKLVNVAPIRSRGA